MFINLPTSGLVVLLGAPASGKSTFASLAFDKGSVISVDGVRALIGGRPRDTESGQAVLDVLENLLESRLSQGIFSVVDSTGTHPGLIELVDRLGIEYAVTLQFVHVEEDVAVCHERNSAREQPVPVSEVNRISESAAFAAIGLASGGHVVTKLADHVRPTLQGRKAFLAMPITEFIGDDGFRRDKRVFYQRAHAALSMAGLHVESAAINENYGQIQLEPPVYAKYDVDAIERCDMLLVGTTSTLSPDIYLEIGYALGSSVPVGLVHPERGRTTGMLRGLIEAGLLEREHIATDEDLHLGLVRIALRL